PSRSRWRAHRRLEVAGPTRRSPSPRSPVLPTLQRARRVVGPSRTWYLPVRDLRVRAFTSERGRVRAGLLPAARRIGAQQTAPATIAWTHARVKIASNI